MRGQKGPEGLFIKRNSQWRNNMNENEKNYSEYDLSGSRFVLVEEEIETEEELFLCNCLDCEIQRKGEKE